jgi:proline iminopeptidase
MNVGDGHEIYVETVGRAGGLPAVYLHGGPGSGCQPDHRRLFDPSRFHAVLFDQRGAGRSRPKGLRKANTLPHLIADMESIRESLGFDKWLVVGGSWGATLALAYAQAHPERVSGIVLRATFSERAQNWKAHSLKTFPGSIPSSMMIFSDCFRRRSAFSRSMRIGSGFWILIRQFTALRRAPGMTLSASCLSTSHPKLGSTLLR